MPGNLPIFGKAQAAALIDRWACFGNFPKIEAGVESLVRSLIKLAGTNAERAEWLVDKICDGAPRCPTPIEMRRVYCQKFKPADGFEENQVDVSDYMNSFPSRKTEQ